MTCLWSAKLFPSDHKRQFLLNPTLRSKGSFNDIRQTKDGVNILREGNFSGEGQENLFEGEKRGLKNLQNLPPAIQGVARFTDVKIDEEKRKITAQQPRYLRTLEEHASREKTALEFAYLGLSMGYTLSKVHAADVAHRDIKEDNIMITSHNGVETPLFIDFGLSYSKGDYDKELKSGVFTGMLQLARSDHETAKRKFRVGDNRDPYGSFSQMIKADEYSFSHMMVRILTKDHPSFNFSMENMIQSITQHRFYLGAHLYRFRQLEKEIKEKINDPQEKKELLKKLKHVFFSPLMKLVAHNNNDAKMEKAKKIRISSLREKHDLTKYPLPFHNSIDDLANLLFDEMEKKEKEIYKEYVRVAKENIEKNNDARLMSLILFYLEGSHPEREKRLSMQDLLKKIKDLFYECPSSSGDSRNTSDLPENLKNIQRQIYPQFLDGSKDSCQAKDISYWSHAMQNAIQNSLALPSCLPNISPGEELPWLLQ